MAAASCNGPVILTPQHPVMLPPLRFAGFPARFESRAVRVTAACAFAAALLCPGPASAARPMVTDDARLTDAGACQLETWLRFNRSSTEYWALPACNPGGNLEITVGGAFADSRGLHHADTVVQFKTLFKPLETDGWGYGLAVGRARHIGAGVDDTSNLQRYVYLPISRSLFGDRLVIHTNIGATEPSGGERLRGIGGIGGELDITGAGRTWLMGEVFDQQAGRPFFQVGLRRWLVPGHVQLDATYGDRLDDGSAARWFTLGLRLISSPLF